MWELCSADSKFSNRHVTVESNLNRDVRFEFESNLEASQVPILKLFFKLLDFDVVGWVTERASGLQKKFAPATPKVLIFSRPLGNSAYNLLVSKK